MITEEQAFKNAHELCAELPRVQERLFRCGMYRTAQKMKVAIDEAGFELADAIEAAGVGSKP